MIAPSPSTHRRGRLRFCGWLCQDGYREDRRHGLLTLPRSFAEAGCCMYCGAQVPSNAERRAAAAGDAGTGRPGAVA